MAPVLQRLQELPKLIELPERVSEPEQHEEHFGFQRQQLTIPILARNCVSIFP